jgi:hypothetical protein
MQLKSLQLLRLSSFKQHKQSLALLAMPLSRPMSAAEEAARLLASRWFDQGRGHTSQRWVPCHIRTSSSSNSRLGRLELPASDCSRRTRVWKKSRWLR